MAVTRASFLVSFPEFSLAGTDLLDATLAAVEYQVSDSFGDQRDRAVMLRTADRLANSPWGRDARRLSDGTVPTSTYSTEFDELARANAVSASRMGSRWPGSTGGGWW
jgi:hypothetical protein